MLAHWRAVSLPVLVTLYCLASSSSSVLATEQQDINTDIPTAQLLSKADIFLASGKGADALELYDIAVGKDKSSYLNVYKRGTAHLALGHTKKALDDFEAVLQLTEFDQARLQAARIHTRLGNYASAHISLQTYLKRNKKDSTALELEKQIKLAETAQAKAIRYKNNKNFESCIEAATEAIQIANSNLKLLELRAGCNSKLDKVEEAVGDLSRAVSISPNTPHLLTQLSLLQALYLDSGNSALTPIKQCLHFDPDSKACKKVFRALKTLEKDLSKVRNYIEGSTWRLALKILDPKNGADADQGLVDRVKAIIKVYSSQDGNSEASDTSVAFELPSIQASQLLTTLYAWTCKAYTSLPSIRLAKPFCATLLERDPEHVDGILGMAEANLKDEKYEEAVRLFNTAFENSGRTDRNILDKLQKAQRLLKQSKAKDYYKVLNVDRDADERTIKKAYRRATLKSHPDKEGGSEAAMAAVNEAYEVLSNPELRARFDNGDDPNDPTSGGGGGGGQHAYYQQQHPFGGGDGGGQQFFHQFFQQGGGFPGGGGGGGKQYKFHFG